VKFAELDSVALMQDVAAKPDDFSVGAPDGFCELARLEQLFTFLDIRKKRT